MRTGTFAIIMIAAIGLGIACRPVRPPPAQDKRAEIIALWTQIRGWRHEAQMDLDPAPDTLVGVRGLSVKVAQRVCPDGHQVPTSCNDVCNLADAICDNAERICDIATELGPDDKLGQEKCESSKASCREAKQRCCRCSDTTKASFKW